MAEELHLGIGGPLRRLERAAHVEQLRRLAPLVVAIGWGMLVLLGLLQWAATHRLEPLLYDLTVHARLLVAMPLFLVAERLLDRFGGVVIARLFDEGYIRPASAPRARALLDRVARWRDAAAPELILAVLSVVVGVAALFGLLPPAGPIHAVVESRHGAARIWYGLVSLPLFQFLLWRSLFHWALWVRVMVGLARVPLRILPVHADRRGGIGFIKGPTIVYCSAILLATSSVLCAGWATQVWRHGAHLDAFKPLFYSFVLLGVLVAYAPLLVFVPQLYRARLLGRRQYGGLVSDYAQRFHSRWIDGNRDELLGTPHIQSLADLGTSFRESLEQMRVVLFSPKDWLLLLVAAFIPAVPFLFLEEPAHEVIKRLLRMLIGGLPG